MKKLILEKKGELTTKQLVTIIVLIVSFVIVLILFFRLNLGETTNQEICRNSIVLSGQTDLTSGPIDCRTNYLCISGGSECQTISQSSETEVDADNQTQIFEALAEEMASCWWQFGEGQVNYGGGFTSNKVYYAICSVVGFDSNINEEISSFSLGEFYDYLNTARKSNSQTYLQYLYSASLVEAVDDEGYFGFDLEESVDTGKTYSIITGVDKNRLVDDKKLGIFLVPTGETGSRLKEDREFITKA